MKKLWKTLTIAFAAIILTGCMKMNVKVLIEDENNASIVMEAYYAKEMLDSYGANTDDVFGQLKSGEYEDWKTKDISKTIDGEEYVGIEMIAPAKECKDILDNLTVKEDNNSKKYTLSIPANNMEDFGDPDALEGAGYSMEQMKALGVEMVMSVEMPGKIESASIGKIDGNTVTIDILEMVNNVADVEIVAKESTGANSMYLYLAGGVAVIAIIAVAIIVIKKKKATPINTDEPVTSATNEEPVQPVEPVTEDTPVQEQTEATEETNEQSSKSEEEISTKTDETPIEETPSVDNDENKE